MNNKICVIDYGLGNIGSIINMVKKVGFECFASDDPFKIQIADKLILPGVGAFDTAINSLHDKQLIRFLNEEVLLNEKPILGICLGMQLMTHSSEEGKLPGFGWINAKVKKFHSKRFKIPHMGWNMVDIKKHNVITQEFYNENRFYFVHSYFVECIDNNDIILQTNYINDFVSGFSRNNIHGVQFHPEKSHKYGKKILENFCK